MGDFVVKETPRRATTFFNMIILCPVTACVVSPRVAASPLYTVIYKHNFIMTVKISP